MFHLLVVLYVHVLHLSVCYANAYVFFACGACFAALGCVRYRCNPFAPASSSFGQDWLYNRTFGYNGTWLHIHLLFEGLTVSDLLHGLSVKSVVRVGGCLGRWPLGDSLWRKRAVFIYSGLVHMKLPEATLFGIVIELVEFAPRWGRTMVWPTFAEASTWLANDRNFCFIDVKSRIISGGPKFSIFITCTLD